MPIFDQGYQHWNGRLSGHAWRWLAITRHGVRTQLSGRYVRLLIIMAWVPALTLVSLLACWGLIEQHGLTRPSIFEPLLMLARSRDPHGIRCAIWTLAFYYFFLIETYFIMLIVTLVGPNLISRDLRNNAFPLYFSRPLTRLDYFLGKLGVIAVLVAAVAVLPAVAAYVLGVCFSMDLSVLRDTWRLLPAIVAYGLLIVVSAGTFMLALSSLSRRSLYVGIAWVAIWLISWGVGWNMLEMRRETINRETNGARIAERQEWMRQQAGERALRAGANDDLSDSLGDIASLPRPDRLDAADDAAAALRRAQAEAAKKDWRPLLCYNYNLERLGETLLGADAAFVQVKRAVIEAQSRAGGMIGTAAGFGAANDPGDEREYADLLAMQYPWTWSAGVLAVLMGISLCVLSLRVKSLDRLK